MSHVGGIPAYLVAADGLRFRPRLVLDTGAGHGTAAGVAAPGD